MTSLRSTAIALVLGATLPLASGVVAGAVTPAASAATPATPGDLVGRTSDAPSTSTGATTRGSATLAGGTSAVTVLIAGDIATCGVEGDAETATLLSTLPGIVMTAGDNAYPSGRPADFRDCYDPTWGAVLDRTHPAPGNHDWETPGRAGYFGYFGSRAGPTGRGWYAMDQGPWRIYVLDSMRCWMPAKGAASGCAKGSPQYRWLQADLLAHPTACVMAVWHHPRFSSGPHGSTTAPRPLLALLYRQGAEIVVNGHDHAYERFAPARPDGTPNATTGIRQFIAGTGGAPLYAFRATPAPNSLIREDRYHGILRLDLSSGGYTWAFLRAPGGQTIDSGSGTCHGAPA